MIRLIGFAGDMGSGKDAAAALVSMLGFERIAFADPLKEEIVAALESGFVPADAPIEIRRYLSVTTAEDIYRKPTPSRARAIAQWWGTEYRRSQDPDYWINLMRPKLEKARKSNRRLALSDVRFQNEANLIHEMGGVVWRLNRGEKQESDADGHASERASHLVHIDRDIDNNGTLLALASILRASLA